MRQTRAKLLAFLTSLFLLSAAAQAQTDERSRGVVPDAPEIAYTVSMPRPHTHMLEVEARLRYANAPAAVELRMPVWTPGSYLVREFERNVQDFQPSGESGRALQWTKTDKNTWRVETAGSRDVRVRYSVYSNELSVRTNDVNDRHAFWNNAATLVYPAGQLGSPSTVRVEPFGNWKVATGLPAVSGERNTFRAENFDVLYDSPFIAGDFRVIQFEVKGVPHRVVVDGEGNYDPERIRRDTQKVVEAEAEMMGEIPYRDYTFILLLGPSGGGGLEHLNSTALTWRRFGFSTSDDYLNLSGLVAHEFYHLWNVKRMRPDALGPFDYTRLLWVAEGITSYYEAVFPRRAGLMTDRQFLEVTARAVQGLQNTPGRLEQSAEESSFDAWIKFYRTDENSVNSSVSYYDKGAILGMLLDLEIRRRSSGARSLDDVMRALYTDYFKRGRNYTPEDFQREAERAAGSSLEEFFRRYVRGREELDYNAALEWVGLRLDTSAPANSARAAAGDSSGYIYPLGATVVEDDGHLLVRNVHAGEPAYEQGLNAGDQIVAVDGYRATRDFLVARVGDKKPGDTLTLTVFRAEELRTFPLKLGARANVPFRIVPVASPSEQQRRNYQSWLGSPFPAAAATPAGRP